MIDNNKNNKEFEDCIRALDDAGIDLMFLMQESFNGYKLRKNRHTLYTSDAAIPTKLIKAYYSLKRDDFQFDNMKKAFITKYVKNESKLEGLDDTDIHSKVEIAGLGVMYEYIHSDDINYLFDVYTLKDLHRKLFSLTPHPECSGDFRNFDVYLPGTGTELSEWSMIRPFLKQIDVDVQELVKLAPIVKEVGSSDDLIEYLDRCVVVGCRLIKVHPFMDGNGRTIRGFINKLLEDAGLPPIYIKPTERTEYHNAMNLANNEGDYSEIKAFYRYKICDSIIELDINERLKKDYTDDSAIDKDYNEKINIKK